MSSGHALPPRRPLRQATGRHVEKGYVYFAMAFSFAVELLNIRSSRKRAHA